MFSKGVTTILVRDLARSLAFYRSLGFAEVHSVEGEITYMAGPSITLGLRPRQEGETVSDTTSVHIGLMVEDIDLARQELERRGVTFMGDTVDAELAKVAFFNDPDGVALYLCQWMTWTARVA
jgi:catechol 2,3-dioxygenase-like lactoylglutathione lyase family enzyme